jgi:hypothetical protein
LEYAVRRREMLTRATKSTDRQGAWPYRQAVMC